MSTAPILRNPREKLHIRAARGEFGDQDIVAFKLFYGTEQPELGVKQYLTGIVVTRELEEGEPPTLYREGQIYLSPSPGPIGTEGPFWINNGSANRVRDALLH